MNARLCLFAALWAGSVAAAWWFGHRSAGSDSASNRVIATQEHLDGPGKPKAPGKAGAADAGAAGGTGAGTEDSQQSIQSILAQIRSLMRTGGMQNPSALMKTLTLLGQIRDEDIEAALKEAAGFKEPQAKIMIEMMLLSRWAEKDGPAALKYATENGSDSGPMQGMVKMGIMSAWAQSDPEAAWSHIMKEEEDGPGMFGGRSLMMMGLFSALAAKDPDTAFTRLAELDDPQERQMALNGIAQTAWNESARERLMEQISNLPEANERRDARAAVLGQLAMMEPEQAMTMASELPADERKEVTQRVGGMLMMSDPERGAEYLLQNAEPDNKSQTYQIIVSQWASHDPNKAGAWLGAQPQTPELDSARSSFATQVAHRDPESAMAWANTVTDENQRAHAVGQVFETWKRNDEAAALSGLDSAVLPPERLEAIRSGKKDGGQNPGFPLTPAEVVPAGN